MSRVLVASQPALHVAITGAAGGIGSALAREFSANEGYLTLVGRRMAPLESLRRRLSGPSQIVVRDLADATASADWVPHAESTFGPIDVLINNAGVVRSGAFIGASSREVESVMSVDLLAPLRLMHRVLPGMLARRAGVIVNIASVGALAPNPGMVHYCAAKAALAAASEALRGELRGTGVRVVTVYPGPIATPMLDEALTGYADRSLARRLPVGSAPELARRVRHAVERGHYRVIYPGVYSLFRYFPTMTRWMVDRYSPAVASAFHRHVTGD